MNRGDMRQEVRDLVDDKQSIIDASLINRRLFSHAKKLQGLIEDWNESYFSSTADVNLSAAATSTTLADTTRKIKSVQRFDGTNRQTFRFINYRDLVDRISTETFEYYFSLIGSNVLQFMPLPEAMTIRVYYTQSIVDVTGDSNEFGLTAGNTTKIFPDEAARVITLGAALDVVNAEATNYNNLKQEYADAIFSLRNSIEKKVSADPRHVRMSYSQ